MIDRKKVVITGGAGYLAKSIAGRLKDNFDVTLADVVEPKGDVKDFPFVKMDITQAAEVDAACDGQDAVVHTVALVRERFDKTPADFADIMVKGTWNVAQACVDQKVQRLINISSIVAIGWRDNGDGAYHVGDPSSFGESDLCYCLAKNLGETIGRAYHEAHGLEVINLRPGVISGDGLNAGPKPPESDQEKGPWFIYVDPRDVAQAVEMALVAEGITIGTYNIVAGREDSLFDWKTAQKEIGYTPEHNWREFDDRGGGL